MFFSPKSQFDVMERYDKPLDVLYVCWLSRWFADKAMAEKIRREEYAKMEHKLKVRPGVRIMWTASGGQWWTLVMCSIAVNSMSRRVLYHPCLEWLRMVHVLFMFIIGFTLKWFILNRQTMNIQWKYDGICKYIYIYNGVHQIGFTIP